MSSMENVDEPRLMLVAASSSSTFLPVHRSNSYPPYPPICPMHPPHAKLHPAFTVCSGKPTHNIRGDAFFSRWITNEQLPPLDATVNLTFAEFLDDIAESTGERCVPAYLSLKPPLFQLAVYKGKVKVEDNINPEDAYLPAEYNAKTFDPSLFHRKFMIAVAAETADSVDDLNRIPGPEARIWNEDRKLKKH